MQALGVRRWALGKKQNLKDLDSLFRGNDKCGAGITEGERDARLQASPLASHFAYSYAVHVAFSYARHDAGHVVFNYAGQDARQATGMTKGRCLSRVSSIDKAKNRIAC
jgi:hypothetical protein